MKVRMKQGIIAFVLVCTALVSVFGVARIASSPKTYSGTIEILEEKRNAAMTLTAAAAAASVGISAMPGDTTTAVADQIMELSSCLLIVVCVIFLEKFLLTLLGYVAFTFVVPMACLFGIAYLFVQKIVFRDWALKLGVFAMIICLMIPAGVQMGEVIENTHEDSIVELTVFADETVHTEKEKSFWQKLKDGVTDTAEQAKQLFWQFVEGIAVILVTVCLIPILTVVGLLWLTGKVFEVKMPDMKKLPRLEGKGKEDKETLSLVEG